MGKTEIMMSKLLYLGEAKLDLTKTLIFEFQYDYMQPKCENKIKLCHIYTDSFMYKIETEDFYKDIAKDMKKKFDTNGYSKNDNRKVRAMIKDEFGGKAMREFVALRAKTYAFGKIDKKLADKHCKGAEKCAVPKVFTFDYYKTCLFEGEAVHREQMLSENRKR